MFKKILSFLLIAVMLLSVAGCGKSKTENSDSNGLPEYPENSFEIAGYVSPREVSEESFQLYKEAGFNLVAFGSTDTPFTKENTYYLGGELTEKALKICKKLGLKANLNGAGNNWVIEKIEGEGYYTDTPFSQFDIYGDYKDIISGVHIGDEPKLDALNELAANKTYINDFKMVYPNADFVINLIPSYAGATAYGYDDYDSMFKIYGESIMSQFDNPYISIDYYPFVPESNHAYPRRDELLTNYEKLAQTAKKYNAKKAMILQSATGAEFAEELTEGDMRLQINTALAYGVDQLQYYCYTVPLIYDYNYCVMNRDDTPSQLYYYLKDIHKEIQSYANVILAYDWDESTAVNAVGFSDYKDVTYYMFKDEPAFVNSEHYNKAIASQNLVISRFTSEKYGEAFMLVNYAERDQSNIATVTFKNCKKVAVYGGNGYNGTPKIVELDEENKYKTELQYGEGVFLVPLD